MTLIHSRSPEEQQQFMRGVYLLLGKQVTRYQKHRRMGESSSIPTELAEELLSSIVYTLELTGFAHDDPERALTTGQNILEQRKKEAESMLALVTATAPKWQTECRWDALEYLGVYLERYDHLHLAHRGPDQLFYPIPVRQPEGLRGIDLCLFYLKILWVENQIMSSVPGSALEALWDRLPEGAFNQCEQLVINGMGKAAIGAGLDPLVFTAEDRGLLSHTDMDRDCLSAVAEKLKEMLGLKDENAAAYVNAVVPQLLPRLGGSIGNLFL